MHRCLLAFAFLLTSSMLAAQASEPKTAREWYDHIQALRDQATPLWRKSTAPADLRLALQKHRQMLALLHAPKLDTLKREDLYIRVKEQDVLADMIIISAMLGDEAGATQLLRDLIAFNKSPAIGTDANPGFSAMYLRGHEPVRRLMESNREFASLHENLRRLDPLWDVMYAQLPYSLEYRTELPLEERIAGLTTLWSDIKYNFAFFDNTETNWNAKYREVLPNVMAAGSTFDYYQVLREMVASLNDGHTNVYFPQKLRQERYGGRPPIRTTYLDGRVFVRNVLSPGVARLGVAIGDEILEVNGEEVHIYASRAIEPFESSSTDQDRLARMYDYFLLNGPADKPVKLKMRGRDGKEKDLELNRSGYPDVQPATPYDFRLTEDGIAIVRIDTFAEEGPVQKFFEDFRKNPNVKGLIFDVRDNGGGNSGYAELLVRLLIDRPLEYGYSESRVYRPLHRAGRQRLVPEQLGKWDLQPLKSARFSGPVAVMTSARTFSAAEDFVSMFKASRRGPIIGEPTGGSTGASIWLDLPGGGGARIVVKRDFMPDGTTFVGSGIQPTILVRPAPEDLREGRDRVLDKALDVVKAELRGKRS